jgi:hypothetical protein
MGIVCKISCGDLKSKVRLDKTEDLKSVLIREIKKAYYSGIQLGIWILIRKYGSPNKNFEVYCATDELFDPK